MGPFRTVKDFLFANRKNYLLGIFWVIFVDSLQLVIPKILGSFAEEFSLNQLTTSRLLFYALLFFGLGWMVAFSRYRWRMYIFGTARKLEYEMRNRIYQHLLKLSANYFSKHKTGDLMAHATNDVFAVRYALGSGLVMIVDPIFLIITTLIMMLYTSNLSLVFFSLLPLPILAVVVLFFGKLIHKRFIAVQDSFSQLTDFVQENLSGIRIIKTFVQEKSGIEQFLSGNRDFFNKQMKLASIQSIYNPLIQFISTLAFVIALVYGGIQVVNGQITLGDYIAFNSYLGLLTWPIMAIGFVINILQRGAASMERLNQIFLEAPDIVDVENPEASLIRYGKIEFKGLTFTYPGAKQPTLHHIDLKVEEGQSLAIVGRTGSGKTTLVNLLLRVYDPPAGTVFIDGHDIRNLERTTIRDAIGYVPQDNFLFSTTITDNIALGVQEANERQVMEAARIAQVHDNIVEFPHGYDTMLGEQGVTLSGGQKQRVSIARAILKNPRILIMDDSLSAVDTKTEDAILSGLKYILSARTSIRIAHRISSIQDADEIVVIDEGRIVERGNHDTLLQHGGIYAELYRMQQLEDKIAVNGD